MTKRDLAEVGLKIVGINFLVSTINTLAHAIPRYLSELDLARRMADLGMSDLPEPSLSFANCIPVVPYLFFAYLFAMKTDRILALLRLDPEPSDTVMPPPNAFLPLGIKLTGLYLFIRHAANLLGYLPSLLSNIGDTSVTRSLLWAHWGVWTALVTIPLALLLMLKTRMVVDIIGGAKARGTAP